MGTKYLRLKNERNSIDHVKVLTSTLIAIVAITLYYFTTNIQYVD